MATFYNVTEHEKICKELNALYSGTLSGKLGRLSLIRFLSGCTTSWAVLTAS